MRHCLVAHFHVLWFSLPKRLELVTALLIIRGDEIDSALQQRWSALNLFADHRLNQLSGLCLCFLFGLEEVTAFFIGRVTLKIFVVKTLLVLRLGLPLELRPSKRGSSFSQTHPLGLLRVKQIPVKARHTLWRVFFGYLLRAVFPWHADFAR